AYRRDRAVLPSVCVCRPPGFGRILILAPFGICQERLFWWGPRVEVALPARDDPTRWLSKSLGDVVPYYWAKQFASVIWAHTLYAGWRASRLAAGSPSAPRSLGASIGSTSSPPA